MSLGEPIKQWNVIPRCGGLKFWCINPPDGWNTSQFSCFLFCRNSRKKGLYLITCKFRAQSRAGENNPTVNQVWLCNGVDSRKPPTPGRICFDALPLLIQQKKDRFGNENKQERVMYKFIWTKNTTLNSNMLECTARLKEKGTLFANDGILLLYLNLTQY